MKTVSALLTFFLVFGIVPSAHAASKELQAQSFEYEKREPIQIPKDFPLVMIPAFHRGEDQSRLVLKQLDDVAAGQTPLVLWTEAKGIGTHHLVPSVEALLEKPGTKLKQNDQSVLLEDVIRAQESKSKKEIDPLLKRYVELDSYFVRWNQSGPGSLPVDQKKDLVKQAFEKEYFAKLVSWGIDHNSIVAAEEKSVPAWQAIVRMIRFTELADLRLSHNDLEGAYYFKELEFKYMVEMVYLRDRKIWGQFQKLHQQYPNYKIAAVIGEAHIADFNLSANQLFKPQEDAVVDAAHELEVIQSELAGRLTPDERTVFIWNNYLKQKLIGQAPDSSNFKLLTALLKDVYGRMKTANVSSKDILGIVADKVSAVRKSKPNITENSYSDLERKVLLDVLERNLLITSEEKLNFEGRE